MLLRGWEHIARASSHSWRSPGESRGPDRPTWAHSCPGTAHVDCDVSGLALEKPRPSIAGSHPLIGPADSTTDWFNLKGYTTVTSSPDDGVSHRLGRGVRGCRREPSAGPPPYHSPPSARCVHAEASAAAHGQRHRCPYDARLNGPTIDYVRSQGTGKALRRALYLAG
jgi:hypothetical protein